MNDALIKKFYELHPEKKEKPKVIKAENAKVAIKSYDLQSGEDSFLQIAEKIKNGKAKVSSVSINADAVGRFNTGLRTYTFEVMEWDTP